MNKISFHIGIRTFPFLDNNGAFFNPKNNIPEKYEERKVNIKLTKHKHKRIINLAINICRRFTGFANISLILPFSISFDKVFAEQTILSNGYNIVPEKKI